MSHNAPIADISPTGMSHNDDLLAALRQVVGDEAYERAAAQNARRTYDPRADLDEDTLRRSRIAPPSSSQSYRRAADMPREPWRDEIAVAVGDYRGEWGR